MKKIVLFLICTMLITDLSGCASVEKKFIRKKKEPAHIPAAVYFEEGPYQKKFSNAYYYKTHYTLWKTWHTELIEGIGGNRKKTQRNAEETLNHLNEMNNYLIPEKQKKLQPMLSELTTMAKKFETGSYAQSQEPELRVELEKIKRLIDNDFYYDKVANQILPDTVNLGFPSPSPSVNLSPNPNPSPSVSPPTNP